MTQFVDIIALSKLHGVDEKEGLLVVHDVAANLLAEGCRVTPHIEHIVPELEGESHIHARLVQQIGLFVLGTGDEGTRFKGTTQQHGGLQPNHVDILLD